jgi:hypothetical protein
MKKLINEQFKRMQLLAGLITESQLNEGIKTIDANSRDFKVEGNEDLKPTDLKPGVMISTIKYFSDKAEFEDNAGKFDRIEGNYIYWKTKSGKEKSWSHIEDLALVKNLEMTQSEQTNELFGFGKSKGNPNNLKAGDEVTYTASNGSDGYNGKYVVGKILSSDPKGFTMGIYRDTSEPNTPMKPEQKQISIYAKPEELKLRESIDIEKSVNEALKKFRNKK